MRPTTKGRILSVDRPLSRDTKGLCPAHSSPGGEGLSTLDSPPGWSGGLRLSTTRHTGPRDPLSVDVRLPSFLSYRYVSVTSTTSTVAPVRTLETLRGPGVG